jgi:hypothetical protein
MKTPQIATSGSLPCRVRPGDTVTFVHRAFYTKTTRKRTAQAVHVYDDGRVSVRLTFFQNSHNHFIDPADIISVRPNASHQAPAALDAAMLPDASSRLPACDGSPTIYPRP